MSLKGKASLLSGRKNEDEIRVRRGTKRREGEWAKKPEEAEQAYPRMNTDEAEINTNGKACGSGARGKKLLDISYVVISEKPAERYHEE